jgi:lysozyme family protein
VVGRHCLLHRAVPLSRSPSASSAWGISKASYPNLDIASLTIDQVEAIYARDFWRVSHCDAMPQGLAFLVFDATVNHGVGAACEQLQEAAGAPVDGAIGPVTLAAVARADVHLLLLEFAARRLTAALVKALAL